MDLITSSALQNTKTSTRDGTAHSSTSGSRRIIPCVVCIEVFKSVLEMRSRSDWGKFLVDMAQEDRRRPWLGRSRFHRASSSCGTCNAFREAIQSSGGANGMERSETAPVPFCGFHLRQITIRGDPEFTERETHFHYLSLQLISGLYGLFRLVLVEGHAPIMLGRHPAEEADLSLALSWISDCQRLHPECGKIEPVELPSRLIYIGDGETEPRLVDTTGQKGVYVALSHCWGTEKTLTTNRANIAAHMECIALNDMPKTYRDAVFIARQLEFEYLWIDSLCIVQGDSEDWHSECAHMDAIFANAAMTIAAEDASDSSTGLLRQQSITNRDAQEFAIYSNDAKSDLVLRLEKASAKCAPKAYHNFEHEVPSTLEKRAWALQELLLSRRVLQFHAEQMSFICNRHFRSETLHKPILYRSDLPKPYCLWETSIPKNILTIPDQDQNEVWIHLIANVSRRFLTYESDKLPSIAAVAQLLRRRHGDTYLAGLWQQDLNRQIAWYVDTTRERRSRIPTAKAGPSWSWASTDYPVEDFWNRYLRTCISYNFELIPTSLPAGMNNDKRPQSLSLRGIIFDVEAKPVYQKMRAVWYAFRGQHSNRSRFYAALHLDAPREASATDPELLADCNPIQLTLFFVGRDRTLLSEEDAISYSSSSNGWAALALQKVDEKTNTFRRVGLVEYEYRDVSNLVYLSEDGRNAKLEELEENRAVVKWVLGREKSVIKLF